MSIKNKNIEQNKFKENVENHIQKILKYLSSVFNNIDLNRRNILNKFNSGLEKINSIFIKNILNNQNKIITNNKMNSEAFLQNGNVISLINTVSRLIKLYMTKESILIKQIRDNITKINSIQNIINNIEENGLYFFNEAKDIFKKLKEIQMSSSKQVILSPTLSSGIKTQPKKYLKNSNSLNHFNTNLNSNYLNMKKNSFNNMKLLAALGTLNNSFTTNSSNNFSNISIEKEYLNTNPSTSIINNEIRNKFCNNLNSSAEKEKILNLKNSFMSVKTETKNSEENISLNNQNLANNLAKKILEFFREMNNLQKAIVQKKNNIHLMKKKFEITKKNIENFALEIQKKYTKKNNNKDNIIIIDDEDKKEINTSVENKKEKINYIKKSEKKINLNNSSNNISKLKDYENTIKSQKEKIHNLLQSNETLIKDKKKLNSEISILQNQINEISKLINEKAKSLNKTINNSKRNIIQNLKDILETNIINCNNNNNINNNNNDIINNNNSNTNNTDNNTSLKIIKQEIENGSSTNKYYEENIQLKKLFQECINIINTIVKNNSKKYSNIEFPSLTEDDSESDNSSDDDIIISNENSKLNSSLEESFIVNGENVKNAIDLFKKYNNEMVEIMSKMKDKIYSLKEANKALNEIIQSSNVEQVEEKELVNFDEKDNFFLKDL